MINLIPPSAQTQVKKEYWLRVVTVWIVLIASAFIIVAVLNVPLYVLVRSQLEAFMTEYAQANHESESFKDAERSIVEANELAARLSQGSKDVLFSEIINELESIGGQSVVITDISLARTPDGIAPIVINGRAMSRVALTTFQSDLEDHPRYTNVVLPLSNLARDRDITFNITVTLETE